MRETIHEELYGRWKIEVWRTQGERDLCGYVLRATTPRPQSSGEAYALIATKTFSASVATPVSPHLSNFQQASLALMHGLLDFGLFEKASRYAWTITTYGEELEPPVELEGPDCQDYSDKQVGFHILSALQRIRAELPREYKNKTLDPEGACMVLQIDRQRFDYVVGQLSEEGELEGRPNADLFAGDFYVTAAGLRVLQATSLQRRPGWQTKEAPRQVQKHASDIVDLIEQWVPKQRFGAEEAYRAALAEYLEGRGVAAPEEQGTSLTDILSAYCVAIETKVKPNRTDYDRLCGQIMRQLEEFGVVIVLILRPDKRDILEEYKSRFAGDDRVIFITKG